MGDQNKALLEALEADRVALDAWAKLITASLRKSAKVRRSSEPSETVTVSWRPITTGWNDHV